MKSKKLTLTVLLFLIIASGWFVLNQTKTTSSIKNSNFSISDTALINKIIISENNNTQSLTLTKENNYWLVNHNQKANSALIKMALSTLAQISIKQPVPKSDIIPINKKLNSSASKIDIYSKNKLLKSLVIGHPTSDSLGTYAKQSTSKTPFIIEIPGFSGYLSKRFPTNEFAWQSNVLFQAKYSEITKVSLSNFTAPEKSFYIEKTSNLIQLANHNNKVLSPVSQKKLSDYLALFLHVKYEDIYKTTSQIEKNIGSINPLFIIKLHQKSMGVQTITAYPKSLENKTDFFGNKVNFDPHVLIIKMGKSKFVSARYSELNELLKSPDYFKNELVKK